MCKALHFLAVTPLYTHICIYTITSETYVGLKIGNICRTPKTQHAPTFVCLGPRITINRVWDPSQSYSQHVQVFKSHAQSHVASRAAHVLVPTLNSGWGSLHSLPPPQGDVASSHTGYVGWPQISGPIQPGFCSTRNQYWGIHSYHTLDAIEWPKGSQSD